MKTLLVGINAKYIHTNLAIRNIKSYCNDKDILLYEATINDYLDNILADIMEYKADIIGFSCYLWNIEGILYLSENIKKIKPDTIIILGGPEVSYEFEPILHNHPYIDFIIIGEGEERFKALLRAFKGTESFDKIDGLAHSKQGKVIINPPVSYVDLNKIPLPYKEEELKNKLVYYETSRGCIFNCAFCLSSLDRDIRLADIEKVKRDFEFFAKNGVKVLKLVDRSFNSDMERALELLDIIRHLSGETVFHCEINPDLVNDEFIKALKGVEHRLQFEVGVQSTYIETLKEISRTPNIERTLEGIRLLKTTGINLHVDLIAGLPHEGFERFGHSFDDVFNLNPEEIQLGFLKLLKGTRLRKKVHEYGIEYRSKPPYEILYSRDISYDELQILQGIAWLVDKYHNTGRFSFSLEYLVGHFARPFEFYLSLYDYWHDNGLFKRRHSIKAMYDILYTYAKGINVDKELFKDFIKLDFLKNIGKGATPDCIEPETKEFMQRAKNHVYDEKWLEANLPQAIGMTGREISKYINFGYFIYDVPETIKREKGMIFLHKDSECHVAQFYI